MGNLGILLFPSPIQHRISEVGAGLAEAAAAVGHAVTIFFLGDGVYHTSRAILDAGSETIVTRFAHLPPLVRLINCSTCAHFRGLADDALIPNATNGTLEDLAELLATADRFVPLTQET